MRHVTFRRPGAGQPFIYQQHLERSSSAYSGSMATHLLSKVVLGLIQLALERLHLVPSLKQLGLQVLQAGAGLKSLEMIWQSCLLVCRGPRTAGASCAPCSRCCMRQQLPTSMVIVVQACARVVATHLHVLVQLGLCCVGRMQLCDGVGHVVVVCLLRVLEQIGLCRLGLGMQARHLLLVTRLGQQTQCVASEDSSETVSLHCSCAVMRQTDS